MDIHFLDFVVWYILEWVIWRLLPDDLTHELGALIGLIIIGVFTIIYSIFFVFIDYNVSDIIGNILDNVNITW